MHPSPTVAGIVFVSLLSLPLAAPLWAQGNFELDPERIGSDRIVEGERWKEGSLSLPPWPRDADLVAWTPEGIRGDLRYFIDSANLRIDPSGQVVRYTLVVEAPSGTRNVSFEGIRCTLRGQYRVYAYGIDRRFERTPPGDWLPLPQDGSEAFRDDLFRHRFCVPRETHPRPVKDMLRALKGRVSANESTGFQAD